VKRTALLFVALVMAASVGCTGELIPIDPVSDTGGVGGGGGGADADVGGGGGALARQYFDDNVEPLLVVTRPKGACTVCHQGATPGDGPDFLGLTAADHYDSLMADSRIVGSDPSLSLLVIKGDHTGDAFDASEISTIDQWILMESGQ